MNDMLPLSVALFAGLMLGTLFFGGLWWTVQQGVTSENPGLLFLGSLLLRTGLVLFGFYLVSQGHWTRLAVCLVGFVMTRFIVVRWLAQGPKETRPQIERETGNAS